MSLLLALLLLSPAQIQRNEQVALGATMLDIHIEQAAARAGIPKSRIQIGEGDEWKLQAWVHVPVDWVIWVDRDYLAEMDERRLCQTAFHEVCHQRLDFMGKHDGDDHVALFRCMEALMEPEDCR